MRWRSFLVVLVMGVACDDPTGLGNSTFHVPDVRVHVVGSALANLDAEGHFQLRTPAWPGEAPIITPEKAAGFSLGFLRTYILGGEEVEVPGWVSAKEAIEAQHGKPIRWEDVALGPREVFFSESHLEPVPDTLPIFLKNHLGPFYHVPLFVRSEQVATISIAAHATGLFLDANGRVHRPTDETAGGEFHWHGVPKAWSIGDPPSPESVVESVATATGARVSEVPYLLTARREFSRSYSVWAIRLEREVPFRREKDGSVEMASTVYMGAHPLTLPPGAAGSFEALTYHLPGGHQPLEVEVPLPDGAVYRAPVRVGFPVGMEVVTPVG